MQIEGRKLYSAVEMQLHKMIFIKNLSSFSSVNKYLEKNEMSDRVL